MAAITSKLESNELFDRGRFGNKLQSWSSLAELHDSDYRGQVCIRYRVPASPWCAYYVPFADVGSKIEGWVKQGAKPELFSFISMENAGLQIFSAEVMRSEHYYTVKYSTGHGMLHREAMSGPPGGNWDQAEGLRAYFILKQYLCAIGWEMLQRIFDEWPDSIVELSTHERIIGTVPGCMTVIWEVRNY